MKKRYITRNVNATVPLWLQNLLRLTGHFGRSSKRIGARFFFRAPHCIFPRHIAISLFYDNIKIMVGTFVSTIILLL